MIGEKNAINATTRAMGIAVMSSEIIQLVYDLRWLVMLSIVLIIADLWLGVSESKMQGKEIRKSKAGRRTFNKFVDYMCYLMVAGVLGKAIGEPLGFTTIKVASIVMLLACAWELDSIYGHICVLNGAKKDFSIRKFLISLLSRKKEEIKEAAEDAKVCDEQIEEVRKRVHQSKK